MGYSTALRLRAMHPTAKIIVLERGILPSGASSKNAGFACFGSASEIYDDIQTSGEDLVWETLEMRWKGLQALRNQIGDDALKLEVDKANAAASQAASDAAAARAKADAAQQCCNANTEKMDRMFKQSMNK